MDISITRALSELKLLDKRITKSINETKHVDFVVGNKPVTGYSSNKEFEDRVSNGYQSTTDLIKRRQEIKAAIVKSNAVTTVKIAGQEMTVAEAIERKTSIQYEKQLLAKLTNDYVRAVQGVESNNANAKHRLDSLLEANFGKDSKAKDTEIDAISKPYMEQNEARFIDPLNIKAKIDDLQFKIDTFESEVDFTLSESNTITKITLSE